MVVLCGPLQQSPASPSGPHVGCIGACRLAGDRCCCPGYREVYGPLLRPPGPPLLGPHPLAGGPENWPPPCCEGHSFLQCSLLPHTKQAPHRWPPPLPRPPLKPIFPPSCPLLPPQLPLAITIPDHIHNMEVQVKGQLVHLQTTETFA